MRLGVPFALLLVLLQMIASPTAAADGLRIGKITIQTRDIFSADEADEGRLYAVADVLHAKTHPSVIRELLLFREGDVYDIPPGHDAWVVGDTAVGMLDWSGNITTYARPGQ